MSFISSLPNLCENALTVKDFTYSNLSQIDYGDELKYKVIKLLVNLFREFDSHHHFFFWLTFNFSPSLQHYFDHGIGTQCEKKPFIPRQANTKNKKEKGFVHVIEKWPI